MYFFVCIIFFREPDLELYNLAGAGHVAIVPVLTSPTQSTSVSGAGPFDDLIEPVKKVQFEIGE